MSPWTDISRDKTGGVWADVEEDDTGTWRILSYPDFVLRQWIPVLMGYPTYHQIRTELSPITWVYAECRHMYSTHRSEQDEEEIPFAR